MIKMRLNNESFNLIKDGYKTIEVRLNDEKRKALTINDTIVFTNRKTNETLQATVLNILHYNNFEELLDSHDIHDFGDNNKERYLEYLRKLYTKEEETECGVLGIKIRVIE